MSRKRPKNPLRSDEAISRMKKALMYNKLPITPPPQPESTGITLCARNIVFVEKYGFSPGFLLVANSAQKQQIPSEPSDIKVKIVPGHVPASQKEADK